MKALDPEVVGSAPDQHASAGGAPTVQSSSRPDGLEPQISPAIGVGAVAASGGMALIVGLDGSAPWRALRLLVTALAVALIVVGSRRWSSKMTALVAGALAIIAIPVGATVGFS